MGRWSWSSRSTVEDSKVLDIFWLRKNDYLCGYRSGTIRWSRGENVTGSIGIQVEVRSEPDREGWVRLYYTNTSNATGETTNLDYKVMLEATRCNYGRYRWWFRCPLVGCGRRVGKLYLPPGANYFGCRHCYNLTYESCRQSNSAMYRFARSHGLTLGKLARTLRDE